MPDSAAAEKGGSTYVVPLSELQAIQKRILPLEQVEDPARKKALHLHQGLSVDFPGGIDLREVGSVKEKLFRVTDNLFGVTGLMSPFGLFKKNLSGCARARPLVDQPFFNLLCLRQLILAPQCLSFSQKLIGLNLV